MPAGVSCLTRPAWGCLGYQFSTLVLCRRNYHTPLKIEVATRREARPRAEHVAARERAGSSIFIIDGVPTLVNTPS